MNEPGPSTSPSHSKKIRSSPAEAQFSKNIAPTEAPVIAAAQNDDERMLATIGYKQVLTGRQPEYS